MATLITSLKDLQDRANIHQNEDGCQCFVSLAGGLVKSSKHLWYYPEFNFYDVHNDIDDSDWEEIDLPTLARETNIIEALDKDALYAY